MTTRPWLFLSMLLPASLAMAAPSPQLQTARQEIAALQLDHALNLSQQQAQALLPAVQSARAAWAKHEAQRAAAEPALLSALNQAASDLRANGSVSPATQQAIQAARDERRGALRQDLQSYRQQVQQILTPQQLQALRTTPLGPVSNGAPAARPGHGRAGHGFLTMRTMLSDGFLALLQARAG